MKGGFPKAKGQRIVRERSLGVCELCGDHVGDSFSHRKPAGLGGSFAPSNGLRADGTGTTGCHGFVEANPLAAEALGWRVPSWRDPLTVPAFIWTAPWGPSWTFLTDDGLYVHAPDVAVVEAGFRVVPEVPEWRRTA